MMTYTEGGLALMAAAIAGGTQIQFSNVELIADPERSAGSLIHSADIASVSKKDGTTILIKAVTDNFEFTDDYYFNQINVYAKDAADQDILFCFQKSVTCPFYMPKFDGRPVQNEISIYITVTSADAVDIKNDGVYVLQTEFEERMLKKINVTDIVQNATTRNESKVPSAAVVADLQDQLTEQNTKLDKLFVKKTYYSETISLSAGEITSDYNVTTLTGNPEGYSILSYDLSIGGSYGDIVVIPRGETMFRLKNTATGNRNINFVITAKYAQISVF